MKTRYKSIVMIALALLMCALAFMGRSCKKGEVPGDQTIPEGELPKLRIFSYGQSDYTVVVPSAATEAELFAAEELKDFFFDSTGFTLPVETDEGKTFSTANKYIVIGNSALKTEAGIATTLDDLDTDGFVRVVKGNTVFTSGAHDRGTLYSVYDFLEEYLGIRFLAVDETHIPSNQNVFIVREENLRSVPAFKRRDVQFYSAITNPDFSARIRLNGVLTQLEERHGFGSKEEWCDDWAHSMYRLLPPDVYYSKHPEWYDDNVAKGTLCYTNEALLAEIVKNLKQWIRDQPTIKYFALAQEDNAVPCTCSSCYASDGKYTHTGTMLNFVNKAAAQIKAWLPSEFPGREVLIETFAYQKTEIPPVVKNAQTGKWELIAGMEPVCDNVCVRLAPIWSCFAHSFMDPECADNAKSSKMFEGWGAICDKIIAWNYNNYFMDYSLYFNNWSTVAKNFQTYYENNTIEMLDQGAVDTPETNFQALRIYLSAKLQWNPYQDAGDIIDEFLRLYYGPGYQTVKDYMTLWNTHFSTMTADYAAHQWVWDNVDYYSGSNFPARFIYQTLDMFDKGFETLANITDPVLAEKYTNRLLSASITPRYYTIRNYSYYFDPSTRIDFINAWYRDTEKVGLKKFNEVDFMLTFYDQLLK